MIAALKIPPMKGKPTLILCHTHKGKGVSFMEDQVGWHGKAPNEQQRAEALKDCLLYTSTTTSMLSQVLMECGMDPSIHIGGSLDFIGGSTHIGRSGMFVAEACEFNASFLHLRPTVAVVLNIDADHLDFYRDIDHIEETFGKFLALLPPDGTAIGNGDDPRILRLFLSLIHI